MNKNNLLKCLILLLIIPQILYSGEPGDEIPGEIKKEVEKKIESKDLNRELIDTKNIEKLIEKSLEPKTTTVDLPKNRLTYMFGQAFLEKINNQNIKIIKNCQPLSNVEKCYVVDPKKKSKHFNTYYFYTNIDKKVNAIIAFNRKKLTDVAKCKKKMDEWVVFFENFDLQKETSGDQNLSIFYSDKPHQKPLEIVFNCYAESFRDIDSSFILKFYKQG
jgi:hypothetical protein